MTELHLPRSAGFAFYYPKNFSALIDFYYWQIILFQVFSSFPLSEHCFSVAGFGQKAEEHDWA